MQRQHQQDDVAAVRLLRQDLVLRPEAREQREARQRERAQAHRHEGDRHRPTQAAHLANVVGLDRVDDRAGAQEEQCLEEGVREEVEHARRHAARAERQEHVAELADRREGQDALDVVVDQAHRRREDRREAADDRDDRQRQGHRLEQRERARHQVDARGDHGRGMDQGGDRRRALHRVWQPDVERELAALADRAQEDPDARPEQDRLTQDAGREQRSDAGTGDLEQLVETGVCRCSPTG